MYKSEGGVMASLLFSSLKLPPLSFFMSLARTQGCRLKAYSGVALPLDYSRA